MLDVVGKRLDRGSVRVNSVWGANASESMSPFTLIFVNPSYYKGMIAHTVFHSQHKWNSMNLIQLSRDSSSRNEIELYDYW